VDNLAIYIHWPFCKSKCPYCDFNSHVRAEINLQDWNIAYLADIQSHSELISGKKISSIFFGGGTPSLMPGFIVSNIISKLAKIGKIDQNTEITLEANPTSVEAAKFKEFLSAGINRVSLGIQSLDDEQLKFLGREHNSKEAISAINLAQEIFPRYSFDLIYALPNQTLKSWENELSQALNLVQKHISLYQLTIEKGTPFYSLYQNKKFKLPKEELAKDFYLLTQDIMANAGLLAYEISNHAKNGEECRHNLSYWQYDDFLGIGPGAHSRFNNHASHSVYHPETWLKNILAQESPIQSSIALTLEERISEILLMGLRLSQGISETDFIKKTNLNFSQALDNKKLNWLIENNFLTLKNNYLFANMNGKLVLNYIIQQLLEK